MVTTSRLENWQEIETISQQLSELACQGRWEDLPEMESKRCQMLEKFFFEPVSDDLSSAIASGIKRILKADEEIARLARQGRLKIAADLQEIAKGKQVIEAYANNS